MLRKNSKKLDWEIGYWIESAKVGEDCEPIKGGNPADVQGGKAAASGEGGGRVEVVGQAEERGEE